MSDRENDLRIRPGRVRDRGARGSRPKRFVDQVMRAAKKAGHDGRAFGRAATRSGSKFGRGRAAVVAATLRSSHRRVVIKARVVRHRGLRFRSAPLSQHLRYLQRDGVTKDDAPARMFNAESDAVDAAEFAERCEEDRHHFRFIVSPEDGHDMVDLRGFTRELMDRASKDLGTRLDWVAVDHWNTDQPHVHVLVRDQADDGADLVISRDYISRGLRARAEVLVDVELGPRSEHAVSRALEAEVRAERWTSLDRALQAVADDGGGIVDLRPGAPTGDDRHLNRLLIGRAQTLDRMGLAEPVGSAMWTLRPHSEQTLRDLGIRGDIIKTMHQALAREDRVPDPSTFAIHGEAPTAVLGQLADRGLHDELKGTAYVVIEGIDGRAHHLQLPSLEATGDAGIGAIVEVRPFTGDDGRPRFTPAVRSDLRLDEQIAADGATWLDRQLVAREPLALSGAGFGGEVMMALDRRTDHLVGEGLARRQGQRVVFADRSAGHSDRPRPANRERALRSRGRNSPYAGVR